MLRVLDQLKTEPSALSIQAEWPRAHPGGEMQQVHSATHQLHDSVGLTGADLPLSPVRQQHLLLHIYSFSKEQ